MWDESSSERKYLFRVLLQRVRYDYALTYQTYKSFIVCFETASNPHGQVNDVIEPWTSPIHDALSLVKMDPLLIKKSCSTLFQNNSPFWIEFRRIREILWIVMHRINRYGNTTSLRNSNSGVAQCVVLSGLPHDPVGTE